MITDIAPLPRPGLGSGQASIYRLTHETAHAIGELDTADLAPEERRRAAGYRFAEDRFVFVAGRLIVRRWLSAETGTEPADIPLQLDRGRPHVPASLACGLNFSISHSEGVVMVAIARHAQVGIDVEPIALRTDMGALADMVFTSEERNLLKACAPERQSALFFRLWVRKEALLKYRGTGFLIDPKSVAVLDGEISEGLHLVDGDDSPRHVWCAVTDGGFVSTVPIELGLSMRAGAAPSSRKAFTAPKSVP